MNCCRVTSRGTFALILVFGAGLVGMGITSFSAAQQSTAAVPGSESEDRDALWNSAAMLRARAWVKEYCENSAKITPEEGDKYMAELASLSPAQMKLWLLKFDAEHEQQQQRQSVWQQAHQAALSQAQAADRAAQGSMSSVEQETSAAAQVADQRLATQQAEANEAVNEKSDATDAAQGLWGPGLMDGYYGPGGYHVHYHLYPY